jgi:hypothetical protein
VGEVLVDVVQVRAVGPERITAIEHYIHITATGQQRRS